jgi:hypothetical protein
MFVGDDVRLRLLRFWGFGFWGFIWGQLNMGLFFI